MVFTLYESKTDANEERVKINSLFSKSCVVVRKVKVVDLFRAYSLGLTYPKKKKVFFEGYVAVAKKLVREFELGGLEIVKG